MRFGGLVDSGSGFSFGLPTSFSGPQLTCQDLCKKEEERKSNGRGKKRGTGREEKVMVFALFLLRITNRNIFKRKQGKQKEKKRIGIERKKGRMRVERKRKNKR